MSNQPNAPAGDSFIQFQCQQCQHQLKVPLQAAGKRAQCPRCSHVQAVPAQDPNRGNPITPSAASQAPAVSDRNALQDTTGYSGAPFNDPASPVSYPPPNTPPNTNYSPLNTGPLNTGPMNQAPLGQSPMNPGAPAQSPLNPARSLPTAIASAGSPMNVSAGQNMPYGAPTAGVPVGQTTASAGPQFSRSLERKNEGAQTEVRKLYDRICEEVAKIYIGQEELILGTLVALFSSGHVLIESVPGLGKTLFVRTLGKVLGCDFGRIQFTADLMPSDVTGAPIYSMKTQEFEFRKGPVFTQFLLADEINRAPAKTHAALLEIMQEYRVTVDGVTHQLQKPFLVLATQNPIESEGTYNLPEAQLDRFMFKLFVDYPDESEEARILDLHSRQVNLEEQLDKNVDTVTSPEEIVRITHENAEVRIVPALVEYINKMVRMSRQWPQFHMGASPRAGLALMQGARTLASFSGRDYAIPDDVVEIALPTLRHRVILTAEAEVEGHEVDELLKEMIRTIEVPRI